VGKMKKRSETRRKEARRGDVSTFVDCVSDSN